LPIAVTTHGQPFPGPFAVLEKTWRAGQERLAALSTNSVPEIIVEAIRSLEKQLNLK
jgi:hypothetical protein